MGTYLTKTLSASDIQNGMAYGTQSWGAIIAPFIIGLIADRYFSAQKILGVLHLVGAGLMYYLSQSQQFESFYPVLFVYMILYMPTLALVNAVAFKQLTDSEAQFAGIRVWGTIGWIVAGLIIGWLGWEQKGLLSNTFLMTSIMSGILGIF
jgi:sugar phosphate permease